MARNNRGSCNTLFPDTNNPVTDLNAMLMFREVARTQSFTAAALSLRQPKSTVSRAITALEKRLGVTLLERTTRRVALTEAGELYLESCERVVDELEHADRAVGALVAAPRGILRVAVPGPFGRTMLAPLLGSFLRQYPELRLHMQFLELDRAAVARNVDVAIRLGPLTDSSLYVRPLMQVRLGLYASREYVKQQGLPDRPADLASHKCISTSEPRDRCTWRLRRGREVREVSLEPRVAVPDPPTAYHLLMAGVGCAMLAQSIMVPDVKSGRLVRLLPEWEPEPVQLCAVYSARMDSSPKVRVFLQFLRERLGPELPPGMRPKV